MGVSPLPIGCTSLSMLLYFTPREYGTQERFTLGPARSERLQEPTASRPLDIMNKVSGPVLQGNRAGYIRHTGEADCEATLRVCQVGQGVIG